MLRKIYFISSIAFLYVITVGMMLYSFRAFDPPTTDLKHIGTNQQTVAAMPKTTSGKPARIVIESARIDLPVDEGHYDAKSDTWTLSPTHAEFAVATMPANDTAGTTFIYGHGTDAVFGNLDSSPPPSGSVAKVYTSNGHIFSYVLKEHRNLRPDDTSLLKNNTEGSPRLVVQTCSGSFNEWRSEFIFTFKKVQ